jgi:hypothetical protein
MLIKHGRSGDGSQILQPQQPGRVSIGAAARNAVDRSPTARKQSGSFEISITNYRLYNANKLTQTQADFACPETPQRCPTIGREGLLAHCMVALPGAPQLIVGISRGIPGLAFSGLYVPPRALEIFPLMLLVVVRFPFAE